MGAKPSWCVDPCRDGDVATVAAIERETIAADRPADMLANELGHEFAYVDVLRTAAGEVVGFCNYWIVADEVHLLSIAVRPEYRRKGGALALMDHLIRRARTEELVQITLEVRVSNHAARSLYAARGFLGVGIRRCYYDDGEDAEVMALRL